MVKYLQSLVLNTRCENQHWFTVSSRTAMAEGAPFIPSDLPPPIQDVGVIEMNDPMSPFLYDAVNSKKVDPPCIRSGEFMVKNIAVAQSLSDFRDELKKRLPNIDFSITHFENWGTTIDSLLLYVKPTTRQDVCDIIKNASDLKIKVLLVGVHTLLCVHAFSVAVNSHVACIAWPSTVMSCTV